MSEIIRIANINNYTLEFINGELILTPKQTPTVENVAENMSKRNSCAKHNNRVPNRFIVPSKISNELAEFLGKPDGTVMTPKDVANDINAYIRTNCLVQGGLFLGRFGHIKPDLKLSLLFKMKVNDVLNEYNLQEYIKHHLQKHKE